MLTVHVFTTAGKAVMWARTLEEVYTMNPYSKNPQKQEQWERIATQMWAMKCHEAALTTRGQMSCPQHQSH
jgi:hypothetical protein